MSIVRRYHKSQTRPLARLLKDDADRLAKIAATGAGCYDAAVIQHESRLPRILELVRSRPLAWEYVLFGLTLGHFVAHLDAWAALRERSPNALSGLARSRSVAINALADYPGKAEGIVANISSVFDIAKQERAFGKPGEAGDPTRIVRLAEGVVDLYARLLDLGLSIGSVSMEADLLSARDALHAMTDEAAHQIADFVTDVEARVTRLPEDLEADRPIDLTMQLNLTISNGAIQRVTQALADVRAR